MGGGNTSSKGPAPGDPGIAGVFAGGGGAPGISDVSSALPSGPIGPPNENSVGASVAPATSPPMSFSFSQPFGSSSSGDFSSPTDRGVSPFASISNPTGVPVGTTNAFETGASPIQSYGAVGQMTGPGLAAPAATSAPAAPAGVTPSALSVDPTQQQTPAQPQGQQPGTSQDTGFSLESLVSGIGKSVAGNPLGVLGAGAMAYNAYEAKKALANIPSLGTLAPKLQAQADQLNAQGQQLASYLTSGSLPPGLKTSLDEATKAAKATIISNFASRGMSTDPSKNSVLAQELAAVDTQAVISTAQIGQQLLQTGVNESGMASDLYKTLASIDQSQNAQIQQSIANFAAALNPAKSTNIKLS